MPEQRQNPVELEGSFFQAIGIDKVNVVTQHQDWPVENRLVPERDSVYFTKLPHAFQYDFHVVVDDRFVNDPQFELKRFTVWEPAVLVGSPVFHPGP